MKRAVIALAAGICLSAKGGDLDAPPVLEKHTVGTEIKAGYEAAMEFKASGNFSDDIDGLKGVVKDDQDNVGFTLGASFGAAESGGWLIKAGEDNPEIIGGYVHLWLLKVKEKQKELDLTDAQVAEGLGMTPQYFEEEAKDIVSNAAKGVQSAAVAKYPKLKISGSSMNNVFLRLYQEAQKSTPELFDDPSWPMQLADEAAKEVEKMRVQAPRTEQMDATALDRPAY